MAVQLDVGSGIADTLSVHKNSDIVDIAAGSNLQTVVGGRLGVLSLVDIVATVV